MNADRHWFKYEFGFINIDSGSENLYLTKTGNWSEIKNLEEKNSKVKSSNSFGSTSVIILLCIIGTGVVYTFLNWLFDTVHRGVVLMSPVAVYFLYQYMKSDIGANFMIPFSKIESVKQEGNLLIIEFLDVTNQTHIEKLTSVDEKGIEFLRSL